MINKNTYIPLIILFTFLACTPVFSQPGDPGKMKNWELKGYGKHAEETGDTYAAIRFYKEFLARKPKNKHYTFVIAKLFKSVRDYQNAQNYFKRAYELDNKNFEALFCHAQMLKSSGAYHEAMQQFRDYEKAAKKAGKPVFDKEKFTMETDGIKLAMDGATSAGNIVITRMDKFINKADIEFSPMILNDSVMVYGSSDTDTMRRITLSGNNGVKFRNFFSLKKTKGKTWQKDMKTPAPFFNDSSAHTGSGCFSLDKARFYFTKCTENTGYKMICNLHVSEKKDGIWEAPVMLDYTINDKDYTTSQPAIGSCYMDNLDVIYFISDRPGGAGGTDLWYTVYNPAMKQYTKAANAGSFINSAGDEKSPYYDMEAHALYFSSDGWPGLGSLDVFRSFGDLVNWSTPENIGAPVNSGADDLCFTISNNQEYGFFTSNRIGGNSLIHETCCDDIYSFEKIRTEQIPLTARVNSDDITGKFNKNEKLARDSSVTISFLKGKTASLYLTEGTAEPVFLAKRIIGENGEFEFNLIKNKSYKIVIEENMLMDNSFSFNTFNDSIVTMRLDTIRFHYIPEKPVVLKNILYDFDVSALSDSSKKYLDTTLIKLLTEFPDISVEIYSHTDNKGGEQYNKNLSQKRAENVVEYLLEKGVTQDRLKAIGLGQTIPLAKNTNDDGSDNPEGRKLNRRTEFKIFKETFNRENTALSKQ